MAWAVRDVALLGDRDSYPNLTAAWAIKVNEGPLNYRPLEKQRPPTNERPRTRPLKLTGGQKRNVRFVGPGILSPAGLHHLVPFGISVVRCYYTIINSDITITERRTK